METVLLIVCLVIGVLGLVSAVMVGQSLKALEKRLETLDKRLQTLQTEVNRTENQLKALQSAQRPVTFSGSRLNSFAPLIGSLVSAAGGRKGQAVNTLVTIGVKLLAGYVDNRKAKALPARTNDLGKENNG
jgi:predicted PurR-regulated permease PerM